MTRGDRRLVRLAALPALAGLLSLVALLGPWLWRQREQQLRLAHTTTVVSAVRDLARLETAEYHLERVIDLRDEQRRLFGLLQGEDAVLLVAAGQVRAGVDLGAIGPGDVEVDPAAGRVRLRLPPPQIFSAALDEQRTYVHTRRTDLLAQRNDRLEGKAREVAVASFEEAARQSGLLGRAQAQAERVLRTLLRELGFRAVEITWR